MATHAELAAQLLREAAQFYRVIARDNADLADEMTDNAAVYEQIALLVETDPVGEVDDKGGNGTAASADFRD